MIKLSFSGDIKLINPEQISISKDIKSILSRCDYNVINFEAPVSVDNQKGIDKSGPCISQSIKVPKWLECGGYNVISLANNHTMDYGEDGYNATKESFKHAKLVGAGTWEEAYKPLILEKSGKKIGIIACTHREFGCLTNEFADEGKIGCAWICNPKIDERIVQTRPLVDYLFIYAHAGVEYIEQPLPEWRALYKHFVDMGCDGIIASHPHIPMGNEMYKGKPIYYSLGNFCFEMEDYSNIMDNWLNSIIVEITINDAGTMNVDHHLVEFSPQSGLIDIDKSEKSKLHIEQMNRCLADEDEYMKFINTKVLELLTWYMKLFELSGLIPIPQIIEIPLKTRIKNKLLGREYHRGDYTTKTHLLNNLQCESHRWTIERALRLKYNIKF